MFVLDLGARGSYLKSRKRNEEPMATEAFEEIADTFEFLEDWEDRYRHVIDMGKAMPPLDEAFRVPATKVDGCASQVWLRPMIEGSGPEARFDFQGESDAMIVRGLIAVLHALYGGLAVREVLEVDAPAELARLGLHDHLSAQRSNGVRAMVERVRKLAAEAQVA
ncbi:Fe-S metabolism associated SufE [Dinoroseobacter shibae DFL 12 = DSM 16493]|uniref:Fe-S metabolism associated SufE n=2 Tax=Roseobacteraceae TaxID=2854170 RepID=A8LSJ7_DINSH|nr:Fe-S metabolism associated SufE [Dinoroseobacter shibae DFL 12 = DSM 16493]